MVSHHLLKLIIRKILNKKNPKRVMTAEKWSLKQGTVNIIETITCFLSIQCKIKANPTFKLEAKQICSIPENLLIGQDLIVNKIVIYYVNLV